MGAICCDLLFLAVQVGIQSVDERREFPLLSHDQIIRFPDFSFLFGNRAVGRDEDPRMRCRSSRTIMEQVCRD